MNIKFIASRLINLINMPIICYDELQKTILSFSSGETRELSEQENELIKKFFVLMPASYPVVASVSEEIVYVAIWNQDNPSQYYVIGPMLADRDIGEKNRGLKKQMDSLEKAGIKFAEGKVDNLANAALLLFYELTGQTLDMATLWENNTGLYENVKNMQAMLSHHIFDLQENQKIHNPYDQEIRELEAIENGDVIALNQSISETYVGQIGRLAKDALRHHKNVAIGNITLASRAAVWGGISAELSFSMADAFIQQVEEIDNIPEVEIFKREAQRAYANTVSEERQGAAKSKNPLVEGVKNYIFSHLHDNIKITDVAEHLNVHPDYLSHLFAVEEGITIKQYIIDEKIKRSKNLLRYSDYSIQDIAFYLGFSSQSYFTQVFQRNVGETPASYRRKQFL